MATDAMEVEAAPAASPVAPAPNHRSLHDLLEETRKSMEEIAARMLFIKKEGRPKSELSELITQMSLLFITLRQLNREILNQEDRVKAETESAKAPVDFTTLQLHNLLYEKNHYLNAIKACKDFQSKYPDIDLVPEEEFFRSAPHEIRGKALASDPAHDLMLKRLNFELFQRKELCKLHEKLEKKKVALQDTIAERKRFLSSLPAQLKSLKKASLPVQDKLGISHSKKLKQHALAELLPPPLYIAYSQLLAQKEAFGERIELEISGSARDARTFALEQANRENRGGENNARLEEEAMEEDEDAQRRRARPRKNLPEASSREGINWIHPLGIILRIFDDSDESVETETVLLAALRFEYLVRLNVVCVGIVGDEIDILCNLFPDDTGLDLPHQTAKLHAGDSVTFGERNSRPYKWAQHLSGIDFLPEMPPDHTGGSGNTDHDSSKGAADVASGLSLYRRQNRIQTVLQRIRSRIRARLALTEQLNSLARLEWPQLGYTNAPWAQHCPSCRIDSWMPVGPAADSSSVSAVLAGPAAGDLDRRSVTQWEEAEGGSTREDGELPVALSVAENRLDVEKTPPAPPVSDMSPDPADSSRRYEIAPRKGRLVIPAGIEDHSEIMLDSESESEEQTYYTMDLQNENENARVMLEPWQDCASREFILVLSRTYRNDEVLKLEAKVKISMEYPLRPPFFRLRLVSGIFHGSKWYNELRAMEAKVNLHIPKVAIPLKRENEILANQVKCLSMMFDIQFQFGESDEKRRIGSVIDVGLVEPVSGTMTVRSVRGRDRRKTLLYWNGKTRP